MTGAKLDQNPFRAFALLSLVCLLFLIQAPIAQAREAVFLAPDEAANLLAKRDTYLQAFTPFDWAARQGVKEPMGDATLLEFYQDAVLTWDGRNRARVQAATKKVFARFSELGLTDMGPARFILTNGAEEGHGGAPYTRQDFIVFPTSFLDRVNEQKLVFVVAHEIFHIFSRKYAADRDKLYAVIGFEPGPELAMPDSLRDLKITNPDAVMNRHYFRASHQGKSQLFVPVIFANKPFDPQQGRSFFSYLQLKMMAVEKKGDYMVALVQGGKPILLDPWNLPELAQITGDNTRYYFHPEEVLADNFALLVAEMRIITPRVPEDLLQVMISLKR